MLDVIETDESALKGSRLYQNTPKENNPIHAKNAVVRLYLDGYLIRRLIAHNTDNFMAAKLLRQIMNDKPGKKEVSPSKPTKIENPIEGEPLFWFV